MQTACGVIACDLASKCQKRAFHRVAFDHPGCILAVQARVIAQRCSPGES